MNKLSYRVQDDSTQLLINDERVDSHHMHKDESDKLDKLAYMAVRKLNNAAYYAETDVPGLRERIIENYFSIDGVDRYKEYFRFLKWYNPEGEWNHALARTLAYTLAKKIESEGYQKGFAIDLAFNHTLLEINPNKDELYSLLGIKQA